MIAGLKSDSGHKVSTAEMSTGSRDQVYLALRLANLEQYLEKNEPLPLIADDILVGFDDDRAKACLQVLAEVSEKCRFCCLLIIIVYLEQLSSFHRQVLLWLLMKFKLTKEQSLCGFISIKTGIILKRTQSFIVVILHYCLPC